MNTNSRRRRLIKIHDLDLFIRWVRQMLDDHHGGSQTRAARTTGIKQVELSRLLDRSNGEIHPKTYAALERLCPRTSYNELDTLDRAILAVDLWAMLMAYTNWMIGWRHRLARGFGLSFTVSVGGRVAPAKARKTRPITSRDAERSELQAYLQKRFPDLFDNFRKFLDSYGHYGSRTDIALARILNPLLDSSESGFVERSWREISDGELRRFVRAGIVRETILLNRSPDLMRIQEIGDLPVDALRRRYGERHVLEK